MKLQGEAEVAVEKGMEDWEVLSDGRIWNFGSTWFTVLLPVLQVSDWSLDILTAGSVRSISIKGLEEASRLPKDVQPVEAKSTTHK